MRLKAVGAGAVSALTVDHIVYLRGIAQGLAPAAAAVHTLRLAHGAELATRHREIVEAARAVARRSGDSRWRLIGLEIRRPSNDLAGARPPPSLDEWAAAEGLDGFSEAEQLELYAERFGKPDPSRARREARNERLRAQRLALLNDLQQVAAQPARPSDRLDGWIAPELAAELGVGGDLTLADLRARIARGGRWWRGLRGYGPVKAARLAARVDVLIGAPPPPAWATLDLAGVDLSGRHGRNRAERAAGGTEADDDRAAIDAWIAARARSPETSAQYRRETERWLLWCVIERGRALSDATADDCRAYMAFLADVPSHWISRRKVARLAPGWAPFRGSLSIAAQAVALTALHSFYAWLVEARYLQANPWALVNRRLGDDPRDVFEGTSRAFTPAAWAALRAELARRGADSSTARLAWLLTIGEATGLRAAELLAARRGHLQQRDGGWWLGVHGKGHRNRAVPMPASAMDATRRYFAVRGIDFEFAPPNTPLVGSLRDSQAGISYAALHQTLTRFVRGALAASTLSDAERRQVERASTHWLRHTHATRAAERGVGADIVQANLGQSDPRTAARYYRAQLMRRRAAMDAAFSDR